MSYRNKLVRIGAVAALAVAVIGVSPSTASGTGGTQWPMFGQNLANTASAPSGISPSNVHALKQKWAFTTGGDVSARAAVVNGVAYFPDWSGHLYAIRATNGKQVWSKSILSDYLSGTFTVPPSKVVSRTSPAVDVSSNTVYIGTQSGAWLLAIDATTGALKWRTKLDPHPLAIDTSSPVVANGVIYVGVASLEEGAAANPNYPCCSFRGSAVAASADTGALLWKTYTVPPGYNGGAVWGSSLVPDAQRGLVYVTTGNNYTAPTDRHTRPASAAAGPRPRVPHPMTTSTRCWPCP